MADVTNFVVFPIVLLNAVVNSYFPEMSNDVNSLIAVIISMLYVLAGIIRLAWFNITTDGHTDYYQGLPVTFISVILPLVFGLSMNFSFVKEVILATMFIVALLFILNIKIKKPRGKFLLVFLLVGVLITFLLYR